MNKKFALLAALVVGVFFSCEKDTPTPPTQPAFSITVNNEFGLLEFRVAAFLSDADGKVLVYREIPGGDTAQLQVASAQTGDRFDCTIVKITTLEASGSGIKDTSINLTTYTNLPSGETVNLRDLIYHQTTDLNVTFTNVTSVDTIIVPDGLTFVKPQPANNFTGQYRVLHTGQFWLRVRVNGEPFWRFVILKNINTPILTTTLDAALLTPSLAAPTHLTFPFTAAWQYKIDGLIDTNALKFMALGDLLRAPGGAIPVFTDINIFEPIANDAPNNPEPKPYNGYRLQASGGGSDYTYFGDRFYEKLPTSLAIPTFDLLPTILSDNRLVAIQCVGDFDVLVFARSRSGTPNINWEVYIAPSNGTVIYRLPDVPEELGNQFPALKNYDFGGQVRARAELYEKLNYESAIRQKLLNNDPIWQARGGYLGREELQ